MCVLLSLLFTFVVFQGAAVTLEVQKGQAKGTCRVRKCCVGVRARVCVCVVCVCVRTCVVSANLS